ncbi:hypothetical protein [Treponema endosymbiont of Eucomonympha sp.]|uniref:hypothetical protein n=1 Tax=Treponema endosymbiont of Eucomonympha sp. TaxID=1580831 RepID=UPI00164F0913|nr:hypothetical protein [Treponema endosymbiont of Eucomonympha sp.]
MRSDRISVKDGEFLNRANAQTLYTVGCANERRISAVRVSEGGALGKLRCG